METFYDSLRAECGIRPPEPNEQDLEICAVIYQRTGDCIAFYERHADELSAFQKDQLITMIVQGIEEHLTYAGDIQESLRLWGLAKDIIIRDNHRRTVVYWSCIGEALAECWYVTPYMRELLWILDGADKG